MATRHVICPRGPQDPPALSFQQQQLWFLNQLTPENPTYNGGYFMKMTGRLDVSAFTRALIAVLGRHEVLRTRIVQVEGEPVLQVAREWNDVLQEIDLMSFPEDQRFAEAHRLVRLHACRPFDLSRDIPLRTLLLRLSEFEYVFAYLPHHMVWELRSTEVFYSEMSVLYEAFAGGRESNLPPLPIQYVDYSVWQREYLSGETLERLQGYWRDQLAGAPVRTNLPVDRPHPQVQGYDGVRYPIALPAALQERVEAFCGENSLSAFRVLCAAFNLLLSCYTGQQQICLGTPVAPPSPPEVEPLIGLFAYTVVVRCRLSESLTFRALTRQVGSTITGAIRRALPFDLIVKAVQPPRDISRMVLFQVNFRVVKAPLQPMVLPGLEITAPEWAETYTSKFDLAMEIVANGGPGGFIEYRTDLFDESTVARFAVDYYALLAGLIEEPDSPYEELEIVQALRRRFRRFKPLTPRMARNVPGVTGGSISG